MRRLVALTLLLVSTNALAQTPGALVITGRILDAGTDVPLRRARVQPPSRVDSPTGVLTDDEGHFSIEIRGAIAASVPLTITKGGYATTVALVRRESLNIPLELRLARGAAITGVVLDVNGAPAQGYAVTIRRVDGNVERDRAPTQYSALTDDRGEYRIGGLVSGTYNVTAGSPDPVMQLIDGKVQVREVLGAGVQIRVDAGAEVGGVQIVAPAQTPAELAIPPDTKQPVLVRGSAASVSGRVLTAQRAPIRGALVRLLGGATDLRVRTTDNGAYEVRGLRAGRYTVEASVNGQMVWRHGQDRVGQAGRPIVVPTDQAVEGVDIVMPATRAVYGVIVDEHGEPVQDARVVPLQVQYAGDRLVATQVAIERRTDDRGSYRLWGLYEGTYLVSASINGAVSGRASSQGSYSTLYYPGSPTVAGAQRIDLREDSVASIAFAPVTLSQVSGVALDGDAPLVAGTARLIEVRQQGLVSTPRTAGIQSDGTFAIRHVPPGNYVLQVLGDGPGRTGLFSSQELSVGRSPVQVTMKTSHGTSLEGRLVIEGDVEQARCNSMTITGGVGVSIDAGCPAAGSLGFQIAPTALDDRARVESRIATIGRTEFFFTGLFGPTAFSLQRASGDDWYLKSFTINGVDISDTGFNFGAQPAAITDSQLVISRNGASISGRLRDAAVNGYFVVAFSTSRDQRFAYSRRVKFARAGADGSFRISGLPPGNYFVAAVDHIEGTAEGGEWQNPDLLLRLESGAERISLLEGQAEHVSLRLNQR